MQDGHAILGDHDAALVEAAPAGAIEFLAEEHLPGPLRVGRIDDDDVKTPLGAGRVVHPIVDDEIKARVADDRTSEFREVFLRELDHRGIDLDLGHPLDRVVLEYFLRDPAIAASDDQYLSGAAVGDDRHVRHHLVIDELVLAGDLRSAVQHQDLAEELVLEQDQMLVLGLHLIDHPLGRIGHAEIEVVEQGLGNPAFRGHGVRRRTRRQHAALPISALARPRASVFRSGLLPAQELVDLDARGLEGFAQNGDASIRAGLAAHEYVERGIARVRPGVEGNVTLGRAA